MSGTVHVAHQMPVGAYEPDGLVGIEQQTVEHADVLGILGGTHGGYGTGGTSVCRHSGYAITSRRQPRGDRRGG